MNDTETILARDISRDQLVAELRALRPAFEREGVMHMALFGSRARGDNRRDSDVDLAIEIADGRKFSLLDLIGVGHVVEDHVGLRGNVFMRRSLEPDFLDEVSRDGLEVF
jgi:predicted nucleotidyltransferase